MIQGIPAVLADEAGGLSPGMQLTIYCAVVGLASLLGGGVAASLHLGHRKLQIALSFVAGSMLGVGLLHLLPHAVIMAIEGDAHSGAAMSHGALHSSLDGVVLAAVLGFVAMFLLERFFHFHQHESPEQAGHHDCCDDGCDGHAKDAAGKSAAGKPHAHAHTHGNRRQVTDLGWVGASIGLTLHSLLEGIALAAAVLAGVEHGAGGAIAGLSTFVVILFHKPFDGLTVAMLVRASGRPKSFAHLVNALFALVVPLGAIALWFGVEQGGSAVLPYALAFSAGTFLCIATSDLLPELQFHRHDRLALSTALVLGLAVAGTIARIESAVAQSHDHSHSHDGHDHSHDGHDHSHDGHDHAH